MLQLNEYKLTSDKPSPSTHINSEKLKSFLTKTSQTNSTFYSTLKRISIHLYLISIYNDKNKMNVEYLTDLFVPILFNMQQPGLAMPLKQFVDRLGFKQSFNCAFQCETIICFYLTKLIKFMIENCSSVFNLKESYLKTQIKMIERSFEMNKINLNRLSVYNSKYSITIYFEEKRNEKFFQANIDSETTCMDVLKSICEPPSSSSPETMCIVEVLDSDKIRLQRLLPMNLKLISNLSKWNSFNLCAKQCKSNSSNHTNQDESQLNKFNLNNLYEKCEIIQMCKNCGSASCQESSNHKKWKTCYLCIQNDMIKIYKRSQETDASITSNQEDYSSQISKLKLVYEMKVEDMLCYFGLYYQSEGPMNTTKNWTVPNEIPISEEECLTLYDKKTNNIYCVHYKQKRSALDYYKCFYERLHSVDCDEYMPVLDAASSQDTIRRLSIWTSETSYSTTSIARMLKKIIKK